MHRRTFLTAIAVGLSGLQRLSAARQSAAEHRWPALQKLLDEYVISGKLAGAAAAVSYGGSPLAYLGAGRIALDASAPFDESSICRIYSMSKPVTGIAAMMLVEAGKLRLDQPVADVIPEWRSLRVAVNPRTSLDSRPATKVMTMRHLLTHTSGLAYWTPLSGADAVPSAYRARGITPGNYGTRLNRPGYGPQANGLEDMIERLAELPLISEPGTTYQYSVGLDVMGLVIERVSGKPLAAYFRERIFEPLQMTSTGFQVSTDHVSRLTTNYNVTPGGLQPTDARDSSAWSKPSTLPAGGAGLVSTARDFARFGAMLLGNGRLEGVQILRPDTVRLACSNLLPAGVAYDGGGFGAGMRVTLKGGDHRAGSAGALSWGGAAGTLWMIEPARGGNMVFMSQHMPPETYPIWFDVRGAIEADLIKRPV
ncbi:MAG: beta-lactamase family protein [Acidobacteria bacterium]|nr:beta-lactamase family protein [Acidobacteriota bacterium]